MDIGALCKELYFHEMERRDRLNSGLSFPVGLVTVFFGAALVMYRASDWQHSPLDQVLVILVAIVTLCLVIASFFLIRVYWGHAYLASFWRFLSRYRFLLPPRCYESTLNYSLKR